MEAPAREPWTLGITNTHRLRVRTVFIGVDVAEERGCAIAAIDEHGGALGMRWCASRCEEVVETVLALASGGKAVVGIDAPRCPLEEPRRHYWEGSRSRWRPRKESEKGHGRHCEVVVKALGLANPQWTPLAPDAVAWMQFGFALFLALDPFADVHEVFPSASYKQLDAGEGPRVLLSFDGFLRGPKDALDAYVAAVTVREYSQGRGGSVGGGDELGVIVLPRPVKTPRALATWGAIGDA